MPSRRAVLSSVSAGIGTAVAGCSTRDTARIERIVVTSVLDQPVTVALDVSKNGESRFSETFDLPPVAENEATPAPVVNEPWMDTRGEFQLAVTPSTTDEQFVEQIPNRGSGCYDITVQVRRPDLVLFPATPDADGCGTDTA